MTIRTSERTGTSRFEIHGFDALPRPIHPPLVRTVSIGTRFFCSYRHRTRRHKMTLFRPKYRHLHDYCIFVTPRRGRTGRGYRVCPGSLRKITGKDGYRTLSSPRDHGWFNGGDPTPSGLLRDSWSDRPVPPGPGRRVESVQV